MPVVRTKRAAVDLAGGLGWLSARLREEHEFRWQAATPLDKICDYAIWPAGKLLRPALVVESCAAVGGDPGQVLPAALSLEYFHVASLVHDDIVDGAKLRRSRPSVATRFGVPTALLAGDELVFQLFQACAESAGRGVPPERVLAAIAMLAATGTQLCRGQYSERELCGDPDATIDAYCAVAAEKTAALLVASCKVGAILGGGTDEQVAALASYGRHLGVAFQMIDDLRPYVSQPAAGEKDLLADIACRAMTFPLVTARAVLGSSARDLLVTAFDPGVAPEEAFSLLCGLVADPRVTAALRRIVSDRLQATVAALSGLPDGEPRERLASIPQALAADVATAGASADEP
jgi:geranylgeranyl pyrophosphate synthase